jgi:hypothetical protein
MHHPGFELTPKNRTKKKEAPHEIKTQEVLFLWQEIKGVVTTRITMDRQSITNPRIPAINDAIPRPDCFLCSIFGAGEPGGRKLDSVKGTS